ncbi:MAG: Na+/H+ antiporter [Ilumatobacteraceae bacterium]|nr:Na+/H+ antiporter [Ilumatobacteraceae bacterium]
MTVDPYEAALTVGGIAALIAAWVPAYTSRRPLSLPVVLVGIGALFFLLPFRFPTPDPRAHLDLTERTTELVVIVALMGAGLKIDRPFAWRRWGLTWRMIAIAMPITIGLTALAGGLAGLAASSALLLGSVLAPTDPVLASDVQVGEPSLGEDANPHAEDDVRFTLTSEGGLNDAMAFPFVYAAIAVTEHGWAPSGWALEWVAWDLIGRTAIAVAVGWVVGRLLGIVAFRPPGRLSALAETPQGFVAIAGTLLAYGTTELIHGYGFLAVFVAAVVLRGTERHHEFHADLHDFAEQVENLLVVALLFLFGGALVSGILGALTWQRAAVAVVVVFVIRPLSGLVALVGSELIAAERFVISFFGIRGFGSVYYLAYALAAASFADADALWSIVALTMVISIGVHGIGATPAMAFVDRTYRSRRRRRPAPEEVG